MAQPQPVTILDADETIDGEAELIARYVKPHPSDRGRAYAWLPAYGQSVAAIVRGIRAREGDIGQLREDWELPKEAVRAAIAFYRRHRPFIDARILLEDDAWTDPDDWDDA